MSPVETGDRRYCWKCRSNYPPDTKICVNCGLYLDTGEPVVVEDEHQDESAAPDELISDRIFDWRLTPGRTASLVVWAGWIVFSVWSFIATGRDDWRTLTVPAYMILPVILIWFPDALAGMSVVRMGGVMRYPVQPWLVASCGWAMLVGLPLLYVILALVS